MKYSKLLIKPFLSSILIFTLSIGAASAEYLFTAPPRESAEKGKATYGQLVAELSRIVGTEVKYEHPGNWMAYKKKVKSGEYDFIFDGPHFVAWRLNNLDVNTSVKLPGVLSFVLVTNKTNFNIQKKDDLIARKVCVLPSPHLGTLSAYSMFPNQVRQPRFVTNKGGFKEMMIKFKAGKCEAAILRDTYFKNKVNENTRQGLKVLAKSKAMTNQGITISRRIDANTQQKIISFLTSEKGRVAAKSLFHRFSKKKAYFVETTQGDYKGQNLLVDNMIFGW